MSDIVLPELANAVYKGRIRDAERNRRISGTRKTGAPVSVLKSLLLLFA